MNDSVPLKIDQDLTYVFNFEEHDDATKRMVEAAQVKEEVVSKGHTWDSKNNLPEPNEMLKFSESAYDTSNKQSWNVLHPDDPWRLLYCAQGKVVFKLLDGFYAELYFNAESHFLLIAVKGTSSKGNYWSDIKNVGLGFKGGEIDSAFTFAEKVRRLILKFKRKPMLLITGHSLGGYLAQLITYTLTYCYLDDDGIVRSREEPTDDFGIHTVVFDSPAAFKQIASLEKRDPLDMKRFELPIVNFVKQTNIINSNSMVGPHLGLVLAIEDFKDFEKPGWWMRIKNAKSFHPLICFEEIDITMAKKVEHLPSGKTETFNPREIQSHFFSAKNLERLQKYLILAPMCATLVNQLPKFKLSNSSIHIEDESVPREEFIARAYEVLSHFKNELDSGEFDGKQIVDMVVWNLWRADMLKDAHDFSLNEDWKQKILALKNGTRIGGFESYEEMRFVGCMMHNSIPGCFHYDFDKFKNLDQKAANNFMSTTTATLILIVQEKDIFVSNQFNSDMKILYLVIDGKDFDEQVALFSTDLDENSKTLLKHRELDFMGNKVSALDVFGSSLMEELPVWKIFDLKKEAALKERFFYSNQSIISRKNRNVHFASATSFARELKKEDMKLVMISSDAGMGKSTALKQIAKTLQKEHPSYWIVHMNLFNMQKELKNAKDTLDSKDTALELIRKVELANLKSDEVFQKVFNYKIKARQMVLLFDSLDEICPFYRKTVDDLIEFLSETELQIVVTTRPQEGKNLRDVQVFKLGLLDSWEKKEGFIKNLFKLLKKPEPDIYEWFRHISGLEPLTRYIQDDFWSLPLTLVIAVSIYGGNAYIAAGNEFKRKAHIYGAFIQKSIDDTLEVKIGIDKHKASNVEDYEEKTAKYKKLVEILAICTIFYYGQIPAEFNSKIQKHGVFINRFSVAKLDNNYETVSFLHRSYAEYLVARIFVQQLTSETHKPMLDDKKISSILLEREYSEIRKQTSGILAALPIKQKILLSAVSEVDEQKLIHNLIKEGCFELYLQLKDQLQCPNDILHSKRFLYLAMQESRSEIVHQLLKEGAKFEDILREKYVLHLAVKHNLYEQVQKHFVALTLNVSQTDDQLLFPLQYAARNGSRPMVEFLLDNGAVVNSTSKGKTALYYALQANSHEVVDLLLEKNADFTKALVWAVELNREELLDKIYNNVPEVHKMERLQKSLSASSKSGLLGMCKHLCENLGANPKAFDADGETSLHRAATNGLLEFVKYLLNECQLSVDIRNRYGQTPLMSAQLSDEAAVVQWLIKSNANVNAVDEIGKTSLHGASEKGNLHFVEMLLDAGAKIDARDNKGWTALFYTFEGENIDVVNYLLSKSADPHLTDNDGNTCLHFANYKRGGSFTLEYTKLMLIYLQVDCRNVYQQTQLHLSILGGEYEISAILLERGADPNLRDCAGRTCLHVAVVEGHLNIVKLLVKSNADVNAADSYGRTPYSLAVEEGNVSVAEYLENIIISDSEVDNCLHQAAYKGNLKEVESLLASGANIDVHDEKGWTTLFHASYGGKADVVKYLLERSANPHITDINGNTCLHVASKISSPFGLECAKLLVNHLPVDCKNNHKETPLHIAASNGCYEIATFLLDKGTDLSIENFNGLTSLHLASKKGYYEIVKLLLEEKADVNARDNRGKTCLQYSVHGGNLILGENI